MDGWVYVFRIGDTDRMKIGFSKNLHSRSSNLRTASAEDAFMYAFTPGTRADEQALHRSLWHRRVRGEWFDIPGNELESALHELTDECIFYHWEHDLPRDAEESTFMRLFWNKLQTDEDSDTCNKWACAGTCGGLCAKKAG